MFKDEAVSSGELSAGNWLAVLATGWVMENVCPQPRHRTLRSCPSAAVRS